MRFARLIARSGVIVALTLLGACAVMALRPPAPLPDSAPLDVFSATRAYEDVERVSREPHPTGSDGAERVRAYFFGELQGLGLEPRVQEAVGTGESLGGQALASVRNVVAVVPGKSSSGRVFLMAHADSTHLSYGASDDGVGVATLLDTARAILSGPRLENDIVLVFTDAEEDCLCGAEAFFDQDPLARDGGVVLNLESRGSSGPAIVFETSRGNATLAKLLAAAAPFPVATSAAVEVYRLLPNDTDFSVLRNRPGFAGLNSASIDGSAVYHSGQDQASAVSLPTLQQLGANTLAVTRALGAADIPALSRSTPDDATYFPVVGFLLRYSNVLVWPLAVLSVIGSVVAVACFARRSGGGWRHTTRMLGLVLIPFVAAPVAVAGLSWALILVRPDFAALADPWSPEWFRVAALTLGGAVVLGWFALVQRRWSVEVISSGLALWLSAAAVVLAAAAPGAAYLATIPALATLIGLRARSVRSAWVARLGSLASASIGVLVLVPAVYLVQPALGLSGGAAPSLLATVLAVMLLVVVGDATPLVSARLMLRATPTIVASLVALALAVVGISANKVDADHLVPVGMSYALDTDTGQALWLRGAADPTGWSDAMVSTQTNLRDAFPVLPADTTVGAAASADLTAPTMELDSDHVNSDGSRSMTFMIRPDGAARFLYVQFPGAQVRAATIDGRAAWIGRTFDFVYYAAPVDGVVLSVTLDSARPVTVRLVGVSSGIDQVPGFVARPPGVEPLGGPVDEVALVAATRSF
ncbi:M28 family peptidase [Microbacteriaceae bacterium VKM Ac-2855]|nr:M28 family peptidase [Microbacteriaceae bacterium VKM Ac-2855]